MARVSWSRDALKDLRSISDYIQQFDPQAAFEVSRRLLEAGNSLRDFPERGRPARNGARQWSSVRPYVIRYEVIGNVVRILQIRHAAQLSKFGTTP